MRRFVLLALCVALGPSAAASTAVAVAAVPVVIVDGRGWGHGVGLAQDGAYWMAVDGASMDDILGHFYPGAVRGSHTGVVRVVVHVSTDDRVVLDFPDGGEVRSPRSGPQRAGFPVAVPAGGSATVVRDGGGYAVTSSTGGAVAAASASRAQLLPWPTTTTTAPGSSSTTTTTWRLLRRPSSTTTVAPPASTATTSTTAAPPTPSARVVVRSPEPVWAGPVTAGGTVGVPARGLRYRGEIEVAGAPLRVVNELDVEQYLWGLAEVPSSYPMAALQAQIVAARTYALRAMAANGEVCDTQRCQVYRGATAEFPAQVEAVNSTLGTTLLWRGGFASAVFSANAAGYSAAPSEGFGTPDESHPYLRATPYLTRSPEPWQVRIALTELATRLGYRGAASGVRVATTGPSGRPLELELTGDAGAVRVRALEAARAMGLRSTMWTARVELADTVPVAPEAGELIQVAPDVVGDAVAQETTRMLASTSADRRIVIEDRDVHRVELAGSDDGDERGSGRAWLLVVPVLAAGAAGLLTLQRAERGQVQRDPAPGRGPAPRR